jgi:Fe-S cluster assembly iron-binding protein IscA
LAIVNDSKTQYGVALDLRGIAQDSTLYRYSIGEAQRDKADLKIDPQAQYQLSGTAATFKDRLAPMSLTIYSTYRLADSDDGAMAE